MLQLDLRRVYSACPKVFKKMDTNSIEMSSVMPAGVVLNRLPKHQDHRGYLIEAYHQFTAPHFTPAQWNIVFSQRGVLRGTHLHRRHTDHFFVVHGCIELGFKDIRIGSPTYGLSSVLTLDSLDSQIITIPAGIVHGIYFIDQTTLMAGMDYLYDPNDDLGCHWLDADLNIPWSHKIGILSDRDKQAASLSALLNSIEPIYYNAKDS